MGFVNDTSLNWLKCERICKRQRTFYTHRGGPMKPYEELNTEAFRISELQIRVKHKNVSGCFR